MSPGADIRGQGPVLIGVGPNACELNEKITRSGRNQLQLLGCLLQCGCSRICVAETDVWLSVCWGGRKGGELEGKLWSFKVWELQPHPIDIHTLPVYMWVK